MLANRSPVGSKVAPTPAPLWPSSKRPVAARHVPEVDSGSPWFVTANSRPSERQEPPQTLPAPAGFRAVGPNPPTRTEESIGREQGGELAAVRVEHDGPAVRKRSLPAPFEPTGRKVVDAEGTVGKTTTIRRLSGLKLRVPEQSGREAATRA